MKKCNLKKNAMNIENIEMFVINDLEINFLPCVLLGLLAG